MSEERRLTDAERWIAAKRWCDSQSGSQSWRILSMDNAGFRYDSVGFFKPRWKSWTEPEARQWALETRIPRGGRAS